MLVGRRNFLFGFGNALAAQTRRPPNILLMLIDDWGASDAGCYGSTFYSTPNVDRLASEGMRFTQAYSACTVCSPSRAAILTGQYPARLRITDFIPGHRHPHARFLPPNWTQFLPHSTTTIAEALKARGYATASIGKWHLGGPEFYPERQGFDVNIGGTHAGSPRSYFSPYNNPMLPDGPKGEYLTDRLTNETLGFIERNRARPFFAYVPHFAVHTPLQAPDALTSRYSSQTDAQGHAKYAAMIESMDTGLGRVLKQLRSLGVEHNTLIILTSDNGGLSRSTKNLGLRAGKGTAYEGGVRVPLIVRWPGQVKPGSECHTPVMGLDLFPTVLRMAGVRTAPPNDGEDLTPLLTQRGALKRDALFWHYPHYHNQGGTPYSALRQGDRKLIHYYEDDRAELYDLKSDPEELADLSAKQPAEAGRLRKRLDAWRAQVQAQAPVPNPNHDPARARRPA